MLLYDSITEYGEKCDGGVKIEKSFSVTFGERVSTGCMLISALASYKGENAPEISFALTAEGQEKPFYLSHSYAVGKKDEYTLKTWRVPPMFLPKMTLTVNFEIPSGTVLY